VSKITLTLTMLSDGNWHQIEKMQNELKLSPEQIQKILELLEEYNFATVDKVKKEVKINPDFQKLLID
jgi:ribonuclease PH